MSWGESWVLAAGKRLEVAYWGAAPADGRALVLLHEGLGCVALWKGFPQALFEATGVPVMAYSRAGYGMSEADDLPRPLDWMSREAGVLPEVLGAVGVTHPVLVGHSDGATIAALAAGGVGDGVGIGVGPLLPHAPLGRAVLAAVLIAPHFFVEEEGRAEIARAAEAFDGSDMAARMGKYHRDPVATFRGWADAWLSDGFEDWNVEAELDGITAPVLVIQGREDQYGTLAQVSAVTDRVAGARALILEGCRHVPHLEKPADVVSGIVRVMQYNTLIAANSAS